MVQQSLFTVVGKTVIEDEVLICRWLNFAVGEARLVIAPKKNTANGAQRVLKIIADNIDTGPAGIGPLDISEITFSLDGDPFANIFAPIINDGLDPYTSAKGGDSGNPDYTHLPPPAPQFPSSIATPNYLNINPLDHGGYPKATNGGDGDAGGKGGTGRKGQNGPILEIWVKSIKGQKKLTINLKGQDGGAGGKGGNGQFGGNGQKGSPSSAKEEVNWLWQPYAVCVQQPGMGGDGGRGGDAGCGGDGGDGGNGGFVKIFYTPTAAAGLSLISPPQLQGGAGGDVGQPGEPGTGGEPGPPGYLVQIPGLAGVCSAASGAQRGKNGEGYSEKEPQPARKGKPGKEGGIYKQQVDAIPDFGIWL